MNQKKAKALRKELNKFTKERLCSRDEKESREYKTFVSNTKLKSIYQFDAQGHVNIVERPQECFQTECVSGGRKVYKEMKKRLSRQGYVGSELMEMPSEEIINEFITSAKAELAEEKAND